MWLKPIFLYLELRVLFCKKMPHHLPSLTSAIRIYQDSKKWEFLKIANSCLLGTVEFFLNRTIFRDSIEIFAKKYNVFSTVFRCSHKQLKKATFLLRKMYKIAKNRSILKNSTVPSRKQFAIFRNTRFIKSLQNSFNF